MAITNTFHPTSGWTTPVFPVYNDATHLFTSPSQGRAGYKMIGNLMIDDILVQPLDCYPFDGAVKINPQPSENYLLHNFNYNCAPVANNPDAVKKISLQVAEQYSRNLSYSSVTSGTGWYFTNVKLNFTTPHNLTFDDRLYLIPKNPLINPQYQNYWRVIGSTSTTVDIDCPYVYSQQLEVGIAMEGCEFFDHIINSDGNLVIQTTNPHQFNSGDTVTLVMDQWSAGKFLLTGGTTGDTIQILVNGVDIAGGAVTYTTSLDQVASTLALFTELTVTTPDYHAFHVAGSSLLHIYSDRTSGDTTDGFPITIVSTGTLGALHSPQMFRTHRIDAATGQGWNPQFSNTYVVKNVPTAYTLEISPGLLDQYNTQSGSERGSLVSSNPFVFSASCTGATYYIQNADNLYEYVSYSGEIDTHKTLNSSSKFFTTMPRDHMRYYSLNEINTFDILYNTSGLTTGGGIVKQMLVASYFGADTTSTLRAIHTIDLTSFLSGYSATSEWTRLSFGVGAFNLNNIPQQYVTSFPPSLSGQVISDDTGVYVVRLQEDINNQRAEDLAFYRHCVKHKYFQLIWLNKFGAWDYFPIIGNWQNKMNVERKTFEKKRQKQFNISSYGITPELRGDTVYNIDSSKSIKLYTDWLTFAEAECMEAAYESVEVYLYCPSDSNPDTIDILDFYPIVLMDKEIFTPNERSKLKRFEFNADIANKRINQRN